MKRTERAWTVGQVVPKLEIQADVIAFDINNYWAAVKLSLGYMLSKKNVTTQEWEG